MPKSLDNWDLWCGRSEMKPFSDLYHPFNWRAFHLYGAGMLGDWGCHIIDFAHDFLNLGLPTKVKALKMVDHNEVIFPESSQISMTFPARGPGMPEMEMIWRDGNNCHPEVPEQFCDIKGGKPVAPNLGSAGTLLYNKNADFAWLGTHHASPGRIIPREQLVKYGAQIKAQKGEYGHAESFIAACKGETETQSPFSVAGPLTQVLNLGMICQLLNTELEFDPKTKSFIGNDRANELLSGPPPRKGWESFYNMI